MGLRAVIVALAGVALSITACTTGGAPSPEPSAGPPASSATGSPSPSKPPGPLPGASTAEVKVPGTSFGALTAVRVAKQEGYDRVVFEFSTALPGYQVRYVPLPVRADGSGNEVPTPGAAAAVEVVFQPASGYNQEANPPSATYTGPSRVSADTVQVTEAVSAGDFEAVLTWAIGVRAQVPFLVTALSGPSRLVIDFQQTPG